MLLPLLAPLALSAALDAVIAERAALPRGVAAWAASGVRAAVDREAEFSLPGFTGQGEIWSASWRWWEHRPRVAVGVAAPRVARLRGAWRVDASWERETYRMGSGASSETIEESHTHGGLAVSDWLTSNLSYSVGGGLDSWDTHGTAASIAGSIERRLFDDRVSAAVDATAWIPVGGRAFSAVGGRIAAHSLPTSAPSHAPRWDYATSIGADRVSDAAPLGLWPGAGDGHARPHLLRAHPLLEDGVIDASGESAFGRTIGYANVEGQRWFARPARVRLGAAAFADAVVARRGASGARGSSNVDIGAGLRLRLPGGDRVLRIDLAHGLSDRANALTLGWLF